MPIDDVQINIMPLNEVRKWNETCLAIARIAFTSFQILVTSYGESQTLRPLVMSFMKPTVPVAKLSGTTWSNNMV